MGATFMHLLIWNRDDLRGAWSWMSPSSLRIMYNNFNWRFWHDDGMRATPQEDEEIDPHYREMLKVSFLASDDDIHMYISAHTYSVDSTRMPLTAGTLSHSLFPL
jgi:hypothetical protein